MFNFDNFSIFSESRNVQVISTIKFILDQTKLFRGTILNRTWHSINGGSLEITFTVPLKLIFPLICLFKNYQLLNIELYLFRVCLSMVYRPHNWEVVRRMETHRILIKPLCFYCFLRDFTPFTEILVIFRHKNTNRNFANYSFKSKTVQSRFIFKINLTGLEKWTGWNCQTTDWQHFIIMPVSIQC